MHLFNPVEQAVFIWMIGNSPDGVAICGQFTTSVFRSREIGETGFRTAFEVSRNPDFHLAPSRKVCTVAGHVQGLEHGMTFALWTDDAGYLNALDGVAFGERVTDLDFDAVQVELYPAPQIHPFNPPRGARPVGLAGRAPGRPRQAP